MKGETQHKYFKSAEMELVRYWDRDKASENKDCLLLKVTVSELGCQHYWCKALCFHQASSSRNSQAARVCMHGVTLTAEDMISIGFLCRTLEVFICEPCGLDRWLAKELNIDVTKWQLFLEANKEHYQELEVLSWQRNNLCVQWLSPQGNYHATL